MKIIVAVVVLIELACIYWQDFYYTSKIWDIKKIYFKEGYKEAIEDVIAYLKRKGYPEIDLMDLECFLEKRSENGGAVSCMDWENDDNKRTA